MDREPTPTVVASLSASSGPCKGSIAICAAGLVANLRQAVEAAAPKDDQMESVTTLTAVVRNVPFSMVSPMSAPPLVSSAPPSPSAPPPLPMRRRLLPTATWKGDAAAVNHAAERWPTIASGSGHLLRGLQNEAMGCQDRTIEVAGSASKVSGLASVVKELITLVQAATDPLTLQTAASEAACGGPAQVVAYSVGINATVTIGAHQAEQMEASATAAKIDVAMSPSGGGTAPGITPLLLVMAVSGSVSDYEDTSALQAPLATLMHTCTCTSTRMHAHIHRSYITPPANQRKRSIMPTSTLAGFARCPCRR